MPITEVFSNPTVSRVIFQVRFPNLFFLESKVGEYQMLVMKQFPHSQLGYRRNIMIADVGPEVKMDELPRPPDEVQVARIWSFRSNEGVELNLQTSSLDISSAVHKTYNNEQAEERFRDTIRLAVDSFLEIVSIPLFTRIGLRYIDDCPVPAATNEVYREWYSTTFPLDRFAVSDALEMLFRGRMRRGEFFLTYAESFRTDDAKPKLVLDFDGYAENVLAEEYLSVTDRLHEMISREFEQSIRDPVYSHMRGGM